MYNPFTYVSFHSVELDVAQHFGIERCPESEELIGKYVSCYRDCGMTRTVFNLKAFQDEVSEMRQLPSFLESYVGQGRMDVVFVKAKDYEFGFAPVCPHDEQDVAQFEDAMCDMILHNKMDYMTDAVTRIMAAVPSINRDQAEKAFDALTSECMCLSEDNKAMTLSCDDCHGCGLISYELENLSPLAVMAVLGLGRLSTTFQIGHKYGLTPQDSRKVLLCMTETCPSCLGDALPCGMCNGYGNIMNMEVSDLSYEFVKLVLED